MKLKLKLTTKPIIAKNLFSELALLFKSGRSALRGINEARLTLDIEHKTLGEKKQQEKETHFKLGIRRRGEMAIARFDNNPLNGSCWLSATRSERR